MGTIADRWQSTAGMNARGRKIDEKTAQAILDCKGEMHYSECVQLFADRGATANIVQAIWRRRRWVHLRQQQKA